MIPETISMARMVPGLRAHPGRDGQTGPMIAIVSQAWTLDAGAAADAYVRGSEEFLPFLRRQPGFRGRLLLRGTDDPTHFTNVRFFDRAEDYDELIHRDGYADRINALGVHLDLETPPVKETVEVAFADLDGFAP